MFNERGVIHDKAKARQLVIFEGMKWGTITPTDIDAVLDFGGRLIIFIEVKYGLNDITTGQRILFERLCDFINTKDRVAVGIVCNHSSQSDISLRECFVYKVRYKYEWHNYNGKITVNEAIERLRKIHL